MSPRDRVVLNCEILKTTDDFLKQLKLHAADQHGVARLSYGWVIDELVRAYKGRCNTTETLPVLDTLSKSG